MDDTLGRLLQLAWKTVPAAQANEAILRARAATAQGELALRRGDLDDAAPSPDPDGPTALARSYELAFTPELTFPRFVAEQLPRLVYHLESVGAFLPRAGGVVLCVFEGDQLHFLQAGEFVMACGRELSLSAADLSRLYGTGESRTARRSSQPPLALPGNGGES